MGCGDNEAACFEMAVHKGHEQFLRGFIQAHAGFIKQPDGAGDEGEPCQRKAAFLAG